MTSLKPRRRGAPKGYVLKTLKPKRDESTTASVPCSRGHRDRAGCTGQSRHQVIHHVIDLSDDKVDRKIRKHCFRSHPHEYLENGSDAKLAPAVQAAYQAVRTEITKLRKLRMHASRSMTEGRKCWKQSYQQIKKFLLDSSFQDKNSLNLILDRYGAWCLSELNACYTRLHGFFGFTEENLLAVAELPRERPSRIWKFLKEENRKSVHNA